MIELSWCTLTVLAEWRRSRGFWITNRKGYSCLGSEGSFVFYFPTSYFFSLNFSKIVSQELILDTCFLFTVGYEF